MKKFYIGIAIATFVMVCAAESILALKMAQQEKEEREASASQGAEEENHG